MADIPDRTHRRARRLMPQVWASAAIMAIAIGATLAAVFGSTSGAQDPPNRQPGFGARVQPAAFELDNYASCAGMLAAVRTHAAQAVVTDGFATTPFPIAAPGVAQANALGSVPAAANAAGNSAGGSTAQSSPQTSVTNVQEPGVDEPDIVKTDGDRVLILVDGQLRVLDAGTGRIVGSLDLTVYQGWQDAQLLAYGSTALVMLGTGNAPGYAEGEAGAVMEPAVPSGQVAPPRSTALYVNLAPTPTVVGMVRADGSYLDARMVGSTVRLVVRSVPAISVPPVGPGNESAAQMTARAKAVVASAPLSAWQPTYTSTFGDTSTSSRVPCQQISHPATYSATSLLSIYTIDLADPSSQLDPISLVADGDTVYATASSLYVASGNGCLWCGVTSASTQIHRFDISGPGAPVYAGSGSVAGSLLNQYSMSDYDGYLRVATTVSTAPPAGSTISGAVENSAVGTGVVIPAAGTAVVNPAAGTGSAGSAPPADPIAPLPGPSDPGTSGESSRVYVLDAQTLRVAGQVDGLGAGEQIYAVRFVGPLAFVVTFGSTDPLYVLDLSDPTTPREVASLQLSGYSNYLADIGGGRLIGVGQEVNTSAIVTGLQLSMFDVSNPALPARVAHLALPGTPNESQFDPHAFLYWPTTGLIAVPLQSWSSAQSGEVLVARAVGHELRTVGILANPGGTSSDDGLGIQRSLIVDGTLWTVSGSGVLVSADSTLHRLAWISFS